MRLQADFLDCIWGASLRAPYCGCGEGRFRAEGARRAGRGSTLQIVIAVERRLYGFGRQGTLLDA